MSYKIFDHIFLNPKLDKLKYLTHGTRLLCLNNHKYTDNDLIQFRLSELAKSVTNLNTAKITDLYSLHTTTNDITEFSIDYEDFDGKYSTKFQIKARTKGNNITMIYINIIDIFNPTLVNMKYD